MAVLFSLQHINKWYLTLAGQHIDAIRDVSFEINEDEILGLVGPSGCGKSTLLRLISGVDKASSGELTSHLGDAKAIGYIFQESSLMRWRTVAANIRLPLEIIGREDPETMDKLVHLMSLDGFEDSFPNELSGGMQRRVAIARALVHSPRMLLMDEPFTGIDEITKEGLQNELNQIVRSLKVTGVLVTHDIEEAVYLADRILVMSSRPGRVIHELTVPLPRERRPIMRSEQSFIESCRTIREKLKLL